MEKKKYNKYQIGMRIAVIGAIGLVGIICFLIEVLL